MGAYEIRALKFESDQATGTAPLTVASTTVVTNLNADLLDGVQGSLYSQIVATETLTNKTLTAPKFADLGFIADDQGNEVIILDKTSNSAVNEITIANGATGIDAGITASGETNTGIKISGKGTSGVVISNATANGAYLGFDTKVADSTFSGMGVETARLYLKQVDANNNALAVKIQKAGAMVEVQLTSPGAICGGCGGTDGAKDPTYDFERSMMLLELYCGHSYEVPMTNWTRVA